jgi:hypothetical protein
MPSLRTLLILARASNLPTVWSNCVAAWWLGGGGGLWSLLALCAGASLLYVAGMYLNDAADATFDRQHRRERPIPAGHIAEKLVWRIGFGMLAAGSLLVIGVGSFAPGSKLLVREPTRAATRSNLTVASEMRATTEGQAVPAVLSADETANVSAKNRTTQTTRLHPSGLKHRAITIALTLALAALIVVYDVIHKAAMFSPWLMGACRSLLFFAVASAGQDGLTGLAVWSGLVLGVYVAGLSYFARLERMLRRPEWWPCVLLAAPLVLAFVVNAGPYRQDSLLLSFVLILWVARSLRPALGSAQQNISRAVAALLAGIVFVDLLSTGGNPKELGVVFLLLFGATLLFQKFVPAT